MTTSPLILVHHITSLFHITWSLTLRSTLTVISGPRKPQVRCNIVKSHLRRYHVIKRLTWVGTGCGYVSSFFSETDSNPTHPSRGAVVCVCVSGGCWGVVGGCETSQTDSTLHNIVHSDLPQVQREALFRVI